MKLSDNSIVSSEKCYALIYVLDNAALAILSRLSQNKQGARKRDLLATTVANCEIIRKSSFLPFLCCYENIPHFITQLAEGKKYSRGGEIGRTD